MEGGGAREREEKQTKRQAGRGWQQRTPPALKEAADLALLHICGKHVLELSNGLLDALFLRSFLGAPKSRLDGVCDVGLVKGVPANSAMSVGRKGQDGSRLIT